MVLVKNLKFFLLFILGKIGMEKVFDYIFHSKKGFLDNKDFDFKKSKNCVFPKDLVHAFGIEFLNFSYFYFRQKKKRS